MAEQSGSNNNVLYLIVGGLIVAMAVGGFVLHGGYIGGHGVTTTSEKTTTSAPATATSLAATATTATTTSKP